MADVVGHTAFTDSTQSSQYIVLFDKSASDHYALVKLEIASGVSNFDRGEITLSNNEFPTIFWRQLLS